MKYLLTAFFAALTLLTNAQAPSEPRLFEVGLLMGLTNYSGDVAEERVELSETRIGYGTFLRYHFAPKFSAKAHFYSGNISGDDINNGDLAIRKFRFSTNIVELGLVGEWNILSRARMNDTGVLNPQVTPYVFGGIGATFAKQEAECYGSREDCDKYTTTPFPEPGLRTKFLSIPVGIGLRFDMLDRLIFGTEIGWRPIFSDDLDGISINGNPNKDDWYYFVGVTFSYILTNPYKYKRN